jgi:hypothetical protein
MNVIIYEGYSESSLQGAVNKTSNEKKKLLYKEYIIQLLLNVVSVRTETHVIS